MKKTTNKAILFNQLYNKMEKKSNQRTRNWTFILYPESAVDNWEKILQDLKIKIAISPLHDKDFNEGTGELKKPHYHILLIFESKKSYNQILEITKSLNGTIPQICNSTKGLIRYFIHKDNPEKFQYDINDIYVYGDIDIVSPFKTSTSRYEAINAMIEFINTNGITEFEDIVEYSRLNNIEWFRFLCDNSTYIIDKYIKSKRHRKKES